MIAAFPARQAVMLPVIDANMNRAGPVPPPAVITKSEVPLKTVPVGRFPGIVTLRGFLITGLPAMSPAKRVAVLVPLLAVQKGLPPDCEIPQGLTNLGSRIRPR